MYKEDMTEDTKLPMTVMDLVDMLDDTYPVIVAKPTDTMQTIMYKAGQRSVVEFLLSLKKDNDEGDNLLTNNILNK